MARNETKIDITAEDKTGAAFSSVSSRLLGVEQSFGRVSAMIGGVSAAALVGYIGTAVKDAANFADEMGKAAQKVGTTTEALSGLKYAADLSDVSFEQLQVGLSKLAKTSEDFRDGSKSAADAFAKIRLDPAQYKDTSELFAAVADKLSKMEDGARKTAIAQELLGKSGAQLIPLLNGGADGLKAMADEAERFGVVVDEKSAAAAEKFNDDLTKLSKLADGAAIQIGGPLVKSLSDTTEAMIGSIKEGNKLFALLQGFAGLGKLPWDFFFSEEIDVSAKSKAKQLEHDVKSLEQSIANLKRTGGGKLNELIEGGSISELQQKLTISKNQLEVYKKYTEVLDKPKVKAEKQKVDEPGIPTGTIKAIKAPKAPSGKSEAEKSAEDMAKLLKLFDDAIQPAQSVTDKLQSQIDAYTTLDPAIKKYSQGIIDQIKAQDALNASTKEWAEYSDIINQHALRNIAEVDGMQNDTSDIEKRIAELQQQREEYGLSEKALEKLKDQRLETTIAELEASKALVEESDLQQTQIQAIDDKIDALRRLRDEEMLTVATVKESNDIGKELGITFSSAFEDAAVSGEKFGDVLDGLLKDIEKMLLRKAITEPLMNGINGIFGDIFANANGGVYSGAGISAYSNSIVSSPTLFPFAKGTGLMGEAGPEGILPLRRGKDGKLGVTTDGAGSNVTVNVINNSSNSKAEAQQITDSRGNKSIEVIISDMVAAEISRAGSSMHSAMQSTFNARQTLVQR